MRPSTSRHIAATLSLLFLLLVAGLSPAWTPSAAAATVGGPVTLGFTSLPSAQGWIYEGDVPEASAFNVSGGELHQTTMGLGGIAAIYRLPNVVDPLLPFTVVVRARINHYGDDTNGNPHGFAIDVMNGTEIFYVGISTINGIDAGGTAFPSVSPSVYHVFRMEGRPGDGFDLYIDDVFIGHGLAHPESLNELYFGDGTRGANADVDIASYSFQQPLYATGGTCNGAPGHAVLQPINADGTSVFKQKSTVPVKFRVCDANGISVGTPGVVADFKLVQISAGTSSQVVNEPVDSTTPDTAFRWDATAQQWIFNLNTKSLVAGTTYHYLITLNDGTTIAFRFGLK